MKRGDSRVVISCHIVLVLTLVLFVPVSTQAQTQLTSLALTPPSFTAQVLGEKFSVNVTITDADNIAGWKAQVSWDPTVLSFSEASEGTFLIDDQGNLFEWRIPKSGGQLVNGSVEIQDNRLSSTGVSGGGVLATLTFTIHSQCIGSSIILSDTLLQDPASNSLAHDVQDSEVTLILVGSLVANAGRDIIVNEDVPVVLNASRTYPQDENLTYTWAFFDRNTVSLNGMIATYVFDIPGTYSVNLIVGDSEGNVSRDSIEITVRDITSPTAVIDFEGSLQNQAIAVGQQITFSGSRSFDQENGTIVGYYWDVGSLDINDTYQLYTPTVVGEYNQPGTYNVSLTVTEDGGNNNTAVFTIRVRRGSDPLSQMDVAILAAVTLLVMTLPTDWLLRRRKTPGPPA